MDDNCGEWVECMGVASGCGWNLWVLLLGVVLRRYIDFLILLIPTPLISVLFCSSIPTFCSFKKIFFVFVLVIFCNLILCIIEFFRAYKHAYGQLRASHGSHMKAAHVLYAKKHTQTLHILRWTSVVCLQGVGCRSRSRGCALYRDASRSAYVLGPPHSRDRDLELESGVNVSL